MLNRAIQKSICCLFALGLALVSTGCMTNPGNGELVGNKSDPVRFSGYMLGGSEWVKIQAKHPRSGWQTIGWAKSKTYAYHWDDSDWYPWSNDITVPADYWTSIGYGYSKAEVRAVEYSSNRNLPTFEAGFNSYWDPNETAEDLWNDHGHAASATIYASPY